MKGTKVVLHLHGDWMVATAPVTVDVTSISINPKTELRKLEEQLQMLTPAQSSSDTAQPTTVSFHWDPPHVRTQNSQDSYLFCGPLEDKENYVPRLSENSWFCKEGLGDLRPRTRPGLWYTTLTPALGGQK